MKPSTIYVTIAALVVASSAVAMPMHNRHHASSGSAETKALNQKSLEQASAGSTGSPVMSRAGAMSDSGAAAPVAPMMNGTAPMPGAAPMGTGMGAMPPADDKMSSTATPPATPASPTTPH